MPLTTTATWPDLVAGKKAKASEVEAKFDWLEGSLWPMASGATADVTYDLGGNGKSWRQAWFTSINPTTTASGIAIGKTTADSSSVLDLSAIPKAILMPVVTTVQRNALTPAEGMMVYNSTNSRMERYEGGQWLAMNNPIGLKEKVSDTNATTAYEEVVSVAGSGRIRQILVYCQDSGHPSVSYAEIDGVAFNTITTANVSTMSCYAIESPNTTTTFKLAGSTSAELVNYNIDVQFRSSFKFYHKNSVAGGFNVYAVVLYEANI